MGCVDINIKPMLFCWNIRDMELIPVGHEWPPLHRHARVNVCPPIGVRSTPRVWLPPLDGFASIRLYVRGILGLGFGWNNSRNVCTSGNLFEKYGALFCKNCEWAKTCHTSMSTNDARDLFNHLPFKNTSNYDIEREFRSAKFRITQLMNDYRLDKFLEEHYFSSLFEPNSNNLCNYHDEDSFGNLKREDPSHLNIFA